MFFFELAQGSDPKFVSGVPADQPDIGKSSLEQLIATQKGPVFNLAAQVRAAGLSFPPVRYRFFHKFRPKRLMRGFTHILMPKPDPKPFFCHKTWIVVLNSKNNRGVVSLHIIQGISICAALIFHNPCIRKHDPFLVPGPQFERDLVWQRRSN